MTPEETQAQAKVARAQHKADSLKNKKGREVALYKLRLAVQDLMAIQQKEAS